MTGYCTCSSKLLYYIDTHGTKICSQCDKPIPSMSALSNFTPSDKNCPKRDRIYLASPYTHVDPQVMEQRYELALYATSVLIDAGYIVYSPIAYTHILATRYNIEPDNSDWWVNFDITFISHWATLMGILTLPGHEKSTGIKRERKVADDSNVPKTLITMEKIYDISRTGTLRLD